MKVLVCGARTWRDAGIVRQKLLPLSKFFEAVTIIHGNAQGADRIAGNVATELGMKVVRVPADWDRHGRVAGAIRNRTMLDMDPDFVIAFHADLAASKGTKDCVSEAQRRGIPVFIVDDVDDTVD